MKKLMMLLCIIMLACTAFPQTGKERLTAHTQTIHFIFKNMVGDSTLQTGVGYTNAFGEPFTIRAFKYYVSNIQLQYGDSSIYKTTVAPHLVNETDSTTKQLSLTAPEGAIRSIRFLLGVDSV